MRLYFVTDDNYFYAVLNAYHIEDAKRQVVDLLKKEYEDYENPSPIEVYISEFINRPIRLSYDDGAPEEQSDGEYKMIVNV